MQNESSRRGARRLLLVSGALAATTALLGGCAVDPWDRDLMAKRAMQFDTHPNLTAFEEHIYFSKEGSSGGRSSDGGGCGCN